MFRLADVLDMLCAAILLAAMPGIRRAWLAVPAKRVKTLNERKVHDRRQ